MEPRMADCLHHCVRCCQDCQDCQDGGYHPDQILLLTPTSSTSPGQHQFYPGPLNWARPWACPGVDILSIVQYDQFMHISMLLHFTLVFPFSLFVSTNVSVSQFVLINIQFCQSNFPLSMKLSNVHGCTGGIDAHDQNVQMSTHAASREQRPTQCRQPPAAGCTLPCDKIQRQFYEIVSIPCEVKTIRCGYNFIEI